MRGVRRLGTPPKAVVQTLVELVKIEMSYESTVIPRRESLREYVGELVGLVRKKKLNRYEAKKMMRRYIELYVWKK